MWCWIRIDTIRVDDKSPLMHDIVSLLWQSYLFIPTWSRCTTPGAWLGLAFFFLFSSCEQYSRVLWPAVSLRWSLTLLYQSKIVVTYIWLTLNSRKSVACNLPDILYGHLYPLSITNQGISSTCVLPLKIYFFTAKLASEIFEKALAIMVYGDTLNW